MTASGSVAFTATREAPRAIGESVIVNVLMVHVPYAARYLTGGCTGGDSFIGQWLHRHRPDAEHVVVVPADRSRVDPWWEGIKGVTVIEMAEGTSYADRNARLVSEATAVVGFPAYPEGSPWSLRSGTWQAIRMSRRYGNFSQWHCMTPPYQGCIEKAVRELLAA